MAIAEERAKHEKTHRKKTPWSVDRLADSEFIRIRIGNPRIISEL